jgi:hypothetical protein
MSWLKRLLQNKRIPAKPQQPASAILTRPVQKTGGGATRPPTRRGGVR